MKNVGEVENCYGCGVCSTICPKNIINIELNKNGFFTPVINKNDKCIECKLCLDTCSFLADNIAFNNNIIQCYAGWSKNEETRRKCSSGGIAEELSKTALSLGYKVCAVRYDNENEQAEHFIIKSQSELGSARGSKYIQSYTVNGFNALNRKEKYLVFGTPCQIDSLRRKITRLKCNDNFILVDFFCHGVPSMLLWRKYTDYIRRVFGSFDGISWRNKDTGWHDSWNMIATNTSNRYSSRWKAGDYFYRMFLSDACLNEACYSKCKFKYDKSSADIRLGDLWGNEYAHDELGVSGIITFTDRGNDLLKNSNVALTEHNLQTIAEGQMKECPKKPNKYEKIQILLQDPKIKIERIIKLLNHRSLSSRIKNKIKNLFKFA